MNKDHGLRMEQRVERWPGDAAVFAIHPERPEKPKRILVPTDFSSSAARALDRAVAFARDWEATITLLYVVDLNLHTPPTGPANAEQLKAGLWQDGLQNLGQTLAGLIGKGIEVETLVREGLPAEEIVRAASGFDLIVLGQRSKSFWHLFSRHTVKGVLGTAPCPVLVVREPPRSSKTCALTGRFS